LVLSEPDEEEAQNDQNMESNSSLLVQS